MKTTFLASIAICAATIANGEVYMGMYQQLGGSCRDLSDSYFQIGEGWVGAHEEYCEINTSTNLKLTAEYALVTRCWSEGEDLGEVRYRIASAQTAEGPGIVVHTAPTGSGVGYELTYKFCPGADF